MNRPYVLGSVGPGTLAEELAKRGYTYRDVGLNSGRREILRDGRRVTVKDADGCWEWLARLDAKVRMMRFAYLLSDDSLDGEGLSLDERLTEAKQLAEAVPEPTRTAWLYRISCLESDQAERAFECFCEEFYG